MKNYYNVQFIFRSGERVEFETDKQETLDAIARMARGGGCEIRIDLRQRPAPGERLRRWRYRALQWLHLLIFFALMLGAQSAFAQGRKPKAIEPIKIALIMDGVEPRGGEFNKLIRGELNKLRVAFVPDAADYDIHAVAMKLDETADGCAGFIAITLTVTRATGRYKLGVHTGPTPDAVARLAVEAIDKELWRK